MAGALLSPLKSYRQYSIHQFPFILQAGWRDRGTVRTKRSAPKHQTIMLARARTQSLRSVFQPTNQQATVPPTDPDDVTRKQIADEAIFVVFLYDF